jgi:hypothetical protein
VCPNKALLNAIIADGIASRIDARVQRRVRHNAVVPNSRENVLSADDAMTMLNQIEQNIEDLRLQQVQCFAAPQLTTLTVQRVFLKTERHCDRLHGNPGDLSIRQKPDVLKLILS